MKRYILTLFLIIQSVYTIGQNQSSIDSLIELENSSVDFVSKAIYNNELTKIYFTIGDYEKAEDFALKALHQIQGSMDIKLMSEISLNLGNINYLSWNSSEALKYYQQADSILRFNNILDSITYKAQIGMGNTVVSIIKNREDTVSYNKGRSYYQEALRIAKMNNDSSYIGYAYLRIGHTEKGKRNSKTALEYFKKAEKYTVNKKRLVDLYYALGTGYINGTDFQNARKYMDKYLVERYKKRTIKDSAIGSWSYGRFNYLIKNYTQAIHFETKSANLFLKLKKVDFGRLSSVYRITSDSYDSLNDYKNAYKFRIKYQDMVDSVENKAKRNRFENLETKYQAKKKEQEIALLKTQNQLSNQQKKNQRNLLLGGIGLTSLAGIFLFILYRNRQRTNTKLREIDALKTNFFTNISHEFRTPLTLISAPIQESLEDTRLSNEKRKHFEIAQKNTKRLSSLVDQLLELSKIDSGNRKLLIQKNTPTQMVAAWSESFVYLAQQKEIDFKIEVLDKKNEVWFDREALENIIINLLGNAVKYTPKKGKINLKVSIQNEQLNIVIKNTGKGLTNNQIKTIFNRFYQTDGQNEGAGVGLSLVKELTELHSGEINVTSELNNWTLFEVSLCLDKTKLKNIEIKEAADVLPIAADSDLKTNKLQEEVITQNKELPILLIVEDNDDVRTVLADTFKKEYKVVQTANGKEGILKALELIPDIIISDVMMPLKDGIELTKTLRNDERTCHIPIILLTAKAGDENELTGIEVGADDYITKPFNQKILKSKAASLISLRKKLQSRYSQEVILKPKDIAITSMDEKFLERVQKILDEKLVESSFSTEQFSKAIHMSRMQLHRKLKALTGLTTSEFIRSQRLKLAVQILKTSDINISEVGYTVGFNDHAYFSKCFKEAYNCTPSEFAEVK